MDLGKKLKTSLATLPKLWDAKKCIEEMRQNGFPHWRQSEWIGWYFQYLCEKNLDTIFSIPGQKIGNAEFDGSMKGINFDFKAHSWFDKSRKVKNVTILNDRIAMEESIASRGNHGLLVALLDCEYDTSGEFKKWHQTIKGPESAYVLQGRKSGRPQRVLKTNAKVIKYIILNITSENINKLPVMNQPKNSNGKPRQQKYMLDFSLLEFFDPIEV